MIVLHILVVIVVSIIVGSALGSFIVAPVLDGHLPFTSPRRANEIERERGRR